MECTLPGFEPLLFFLVLVNCVSHKEFRKGKQGWITSVIPPTCFNLYLIFFSNTYVFKSVSFL